MKFNQLRNLTAVAEAGSVRQAALKLNLSQPAISKSIMQLEEIVGARLLVRGPRGVVPTPAGEALIRRARFISSELDRAQQEVDYLEGTEHGEISVGVTQTVTTNILPQAVVTYLSKRPQVRIYIEEGNVTEVLAAVGEGNFDFAVCFLPGSTPQSDLKFEVLTEETLIPAVRRDHPLARKRSIALGDLLDEDWVIFGRGEGRRIAYEETFAAAGLPAPRCAIESNSISCTVSIISASDRIALLPNHMLTSGGITQAIAPLRMAVPAPRWMIALVTRDAAILSPVCRELIAELRSVVAKS